MKRLPPVLMLLVFAGGCAEQPVGKVLVYEVDSGPGPDSDSQLADKKVVAKVVAALDRRINPDWTKRARIRPLGEGQIEIAVYGNDPEMVERIERFAESGGTLEFRILANRRDHLALIEQAEQDEGKTLHDADGNLLAWWVPVAPDQKEGFGLQGEIAHRTRTVRGKEQLEILVVKDPFDVTDAYLIRATADVDQTGRPGVILALNRAGGTLFGGLTGNNRPDPVTGFSRRLGIIRDGSLHSAPAIRSTIRDHVQITGDFTQQEVEDLVDVFNSGSLPAVLRKVEESSSETTREKGT